MAGLRLLLALPFLAAGLACGGGDGVATPTAADHGATVAGICDAVAVAATDPGAARTDFARAHEGLHRLADALGGVDRAAAADLLVAKQQVEEVVRREPPPADLPTRLEALSSATRAGAGLLRRATVACP